MSSRREQKDQLRQQRLEREQAARAAERRKRLIGYVVGGALAAAALIAVVAVVLASGGDDGGGGGGGGNAVPNEGDWPKGSVPKPKIQDLQAAARAAGCEVQSPPNEGNKHVTQVVTYRSNPPTSGNHNATPADDGAYLEAPAKENYVHSLEHGRIQLLFREGASDQVRGNLKAIFDEDPAHMMLFPNDTGMKYEVAAAAWGHSIGCPRYNDQVPDALRAFKTQYRDRGPEFVP